MRVLKRVLTRKSILGFGWADVRDLSVQMIIDLGRENYLIKSYYGLEKIDFTEDILDELGITPEYRLIKPDKSYELQKKFFDNKFSKLKETETDIERLAGFYRNRKDRNHRAYRKIKGQFGNNTEYLRAKNHGNL
jgi:hypothetical protein